jgi:hypothetical protein
MLEKKLHEELMRYRQINKYATKMIMEQEEPLPGGEGELPVDPTVPADSAAPVDPIAAPSDPSIGAVEEPMVDDSTEEIDITDLVNMTKSLKNDVEKTNMVNTDSISKMDGVFTKLNDLESKLGEMNNIIAKIDQLGAKIETMKPVTPQERLEMRSLDSYPFSQTPQQFFDVKKNEMRASGKNEYILTKQDVDNYSKNQIAQSFNPNY